MGCLLCNRNTAILLIAGLVLLFLPGALSYLGLALIALAYVMAFIPRRSCRVNYGNPVKSAGGSDDPPVGRVTGHAERAKTKKDSE